MLSLVLLRLLAERESYGYELVVRIHRAGLSGIAEGTVYPALARLERERRVSSRLVPSSSGPARKSPAHPWRPPGPDHRHHGLAAAGRGGGPAGGHAGPDRPAPPEEL